MVAPLSWADLSSYEQDFEGLNQSGSGALADNGWLVFGNLYDSGGGYIEGYGPFGAPNHGAAFSEIVIGQGGPSQGTQQLSIFNDYNCCPPGGHFNGTDLVESNVFQEQTIGAADVGITFTFSFDAKQGDMAGATAAIAFIKTLDPNAGFALTNFITLDTTNLPATWATYDLMITIDAGLAGQILQFGFASTASNNEASSNYYDNVMFSLPPIPDTDGDGVTDDMDNCTEVANAGQQDADGDGLGNICDGDFDNNCIVNFPDLSILEAGFFGSYPLLDLNSDGNVNFIDLVILEGGFFGRPGPSGLSNVCD